MEVTVFPRTFEVIGHVLADDLVVIVKARLDTRDDQPKLIAMDVTPCEDLSDSPPLRLKVAPHVLSDAKVRALKTCSSSSRATAPSTCTSASR